jgi:hypothetical protein
LGFLLLQDILELGNPFDERLVNFRS